MQLSKTKGFIGLALGILVLCTAVGCVFASENMPGDAPGTLADEDMVDILAFALFANGVELDEPLGFDNAESIVINAE